MFEDNHAGPLEVPLLTEVDIEFWTDCLGDYISVWLQNGEQFMEEQRKRMYRMALCPFLFGVSCNLPQAWIKVIHNHGIIEKDRENKTTMLNETELEILEMAEVLFTRCVELVKYKADLKTIMNFIYDVEERSSSTGAIDMAYALQQAARLEVFTSMWAPIKRTYQKKKTQAYTCIVYFFKTISHHIVFYGRDGIDKYVETKRIIYEKIRCERDSSPRDWLSEGNTAFNRGRYKKALDIYTALIKRDPLNSISYGNRAQTYLKLGDYRSALCDCKRAIALDPTNSKLYFRAAKSYLCLGALDKAEEANRLAIEYTSDPIHKEAIETQGREILEAKEEMTQGKNQIHHKNGGRDKNEEKENEPPDEGKAELEYKRCLHEGSSRSLAGLYTQAIEHYTEALDMLQKLRSQGMQVSQEEQVILNYCLGVSCLKAGGFHNLQMAQNKLTTILNITDNFPAVYWALGRVHILLYRHIEAVEVLMLGLRMINCLKQKDEERVYFWPETTQPILETKLGNLSEDIMKLLEECKNLPEPDAYCRFHIDPNSKREIYLSDPDFKGYVRLKCSAKCYFEFHIPCWKAFAETLNVRHIGKDMLNTPCPTPSCWGSVCAVSMLKFSSEKPVDWLSPSMQSLSPRQPKPRKKTRTENPDKIQKKTDRKKMRKDKKMESRRLKEETQLEHAQKGKVSEPVVFNAEEEPKHLSQGMKLLQRDKTEVLVEGKVKASKSKKKEKKSKQFVQLEVQFTGDEDKHWLGGNDVDDEDDDGSVPVNDVCSAKYASKPQNGLQHIFDDIGQSLFEFLEACVGAGPTDMESEEFQEILDNFPEHFKQRLHHYGGIANYLQYNPKFQVVDKRFLYFLGKKLPYKAPKISTQAQPWQVPNTKFSWEKRAQEMAKAKASNVDYQGFQEQQTVSHRTLNPTAREFIPPSVKREIFVPTNTIEGEFPLKVRPVDHVGGESSSMHGESSHGYDSVTKSSFIMQLQDMDNDEEQNKLPVLAGLPSDRKSATQNSDLSRFAVSLSGEHSSFVSTSEVSTGEDTAATRSVSPASSLHSGGSNSQTSNSQASGGIAASNNQSPFRPLKVPKVNLPTRGKKKSFSARLAARSLAGVQGMHKSSSRENLVGVNPKPTSGDRLNDDEGDAESISSTPSDLDSVSEHSHQISEKPVLTFEERAPVTDMSHLLSDGSRRQASVSNREDASSQLSFHEDIPGHTSSSDLSYLLSEIDREIANEGRKIVEEERGQDDTAIVWAAPDSKDPWSKDTWPSNSDFAQISVGNNHQKSAHDFPAFHDSNNSLKPGSRVLQHVASEKPFLAPQFGFTSNLTSGQELYNYLNGKMSSVGVSLQPSHDLDPWSEKPVLAEALTELAKPGEDWLKTCLSSSLADPEPKSSRRKLFQDEEANPSLLHDLKDTDWNLFDSRSLCMPPKSSEQLSHKSPSSALIAFESVEVAWMSPGTDNICVVHPASSSTLQFSRTPGRPAQHKSSAPSFFFSSASKEQSSQTTPMVHSVETMTDLLSAELESHLKQLITLRSDMTHLQANCDEAMEAKKQMELDQKELQRQLCESVQRSKSLEIQLAVQTERAETADRLALERKVTDLDGLDSTTADLLKQIEKLRKEKLDDKKLILRYSAQDGIKSLEVSITSASMHIKQLSAKLEQTKTRGTPIQTHISDMHEKLCRFSTECTLLKNKAFAELQKKLQDLDSGMDPDLVIPVTVCVPPFPRPPTLQDDMGRSLNQEPSDNMSAPPSSRSHDHLQKHLSRSLSPSREAPTGDGLSRPSSSNSSSPSIDGEVFKLADNASVSSTGSELLTKDSKWMDTSSPAHNSSNVAPNIGVIGGERKKAAMQTSESQKSSSSALMTPLPPHSVTPSKTKSPAAFLHLENASVFPKATKSQSKLTSFEKIFTIVTETFPNCTRSDIQKLIDELRRESGGSLNTLSCEQLTQSVLEKLLEQDETEVSSNVGLGDLPPTKRLLTLKDSVCSICFDDLKSSTSQSLECKHCFHEKCIRRWFEIERSCPNCRTFVLPPEEFPSLR